MQNIRNPRRVVVLIDGEDGNQDGWDVFDVERCSWDFAGVRPDGTRATLTVTGGFHRIRRNPDTDAQLIQPPPREIGASNEEDPDAVRP